MKSSFTLSLRLKLMGVLALAGLGISAYQSHQFYQIRSGTGSFESFCNISESVNCNAVMASRFAELAFGIPLSSLAASAFVALVILALMGHLEDLKKDSLQGIRVLTTMSLALSLVYLVVMIFAVKTFCVLCLTIDAINVLLFLLAWSMRQEGTGGTLKTAAITLGVSLLAIPTLSSLDAQEDSEGGLSSSQMDLYAQEWLQSPAIPVGAGPEYHGFGPEQAPVTIVEFSDLQCPHCKKGAYLMNALKDRFPGKVRIVLRHFPLDSQCNSLIPAGQGHTAACEAARAVYCANQQGKFATAYQILFDRQVEIAPGKITRLLENSGIHLDALEACMKAESTYTAIQKDIQEGIQIKINSTPTFFINGHRVNGAYPLPVWVRAVEKLLHP